MPYNVTAPMIVDVVPAVAVGVVLTVVVERGHGTSSRRGRGTSSGRGRGCGTSSRRGRGTSSGRGRGCGTSSCRGRGTSCMGVVAAMAVDEVVAGVAEDSFLAHFLGSILTLSQISPHRHSHLHLPLVLNPSDRKFQHGRALGSFFDQDFLDLKQTGK